MLIHISTNQIAKVHCNAFLSESVSRNLSLWYHFGGDSTLDSWIANVRGWSKHRFRQRLWSVCVRQNQNDFHQFSWSPTYILFSNSKSWFYSCQEPVNHADIHSHSLWQAPTIQRQKNPYYCFQWSKISSSTCDWSDGHFSIVRKTILPIRICAVYYKSFFCFVNLAWRKSQYVYDKQTYLDTNFKLFGPCKT